MEILYRGEGKLLADPDPDHARQAFRKKNKALVPKVMTVAEAVRKLAHDGDYLAIGGFGANRIPTAICHEILRQGRKNMGFLGHTSTHDFQILCAGEVFDRCDIAYIVGLEARGLSPNSRAYMQSGKVQVTENSNYSLALRIQAAAMGVPFQISRSLLGTDTLRRSPSMVVRDPYTEKPVCIHPAIYPDVTAIHVHEADIYGNCRIKGIEISDRELATASKRLIITTERLVHEDVIRNDPGGTFIPYYLVDAVCEVPFGSFPGNMPYEYFSDEEHMQEWLQVERDPERFKRFLDDNIYGVRTFGDYLQRNGGLDRMMELRRKELLIHTEGGDS